MGDNDLQILADGCTALLQSVFGDNNWYRWNEIKQQTQHDSLQTFITWMLDVAEQEMNRMPVFTGAEGDGDEFLKAAAVDTDDVVDDGSYYNNKREVKAESWEYSDDNVTRQGAALQGSSTSTAVESVAAVENIDNPVFDVASEGASSGSERVHIMFDNKTFYCVDCQVSLSDIQVIEEHLVLRHKELPVTLSCSCCSQQFATIPDYINFHRMNNLQSNTKGSRAKYVCDYCAKGFKVKHILEDHIANKHLKMGPRHECPHCSKKFSHANNLYSHKKKCTSAPPASAL